MMWFERKTDYMALLPDYYREIKQACTLAGCCNPEVDALKAILRQTVEGKTLHTAQMRWIKAYEEMLALRAAETETAECRKVRLLSYFSLRRPINAKSVTTACLTLLNVKNGVRLDVDTEKQICYVKYNMELSEQLLAQLEKLVRMLIPAGMELQVLFGFREWQDVSEWTWQLAAAQTWQSMEETEK